MITADEFYVLLTRYTDDLCTEEEERILFNLIDSGKYADVLSAHFEANLHAESLGTSKISHIRAEEIMERILSSEKQTESLISLNGKRSLFSMYWRSTAAAILLICCGGYFYFSNSSSAYSMKDVASLQQDPQILENRTSGPLTYVMEDGSKIVLQTGASLNYPKHFLADKREVYLKGEAFFQISKNPGRPFLVYHNNLITQVLGTSFNIKVDKNSDLVEVDVVTGKVQVSEWGNRSELANNSINNGVILTPNQRAIYSSQSRQFVTSLVDIPLPVAKEDTIDSSDDMAHFVYENATLPSVLASLKTMYKVDIIMENDNLNNCLFTGDLSDPNLFVNLNLIATVIGASYEVKGTNVLLKGKGCSFH